METIEIEERPAQILGLGLRVTLKDISDAYLKKTFMSLPPTSLFNAMAEFRLDCSNW